MCAYEGGNGKTEKTNSPEKIIFYSAVQSLVADCYCYPPLVISGAAVIAGRGGLDQREDGGGVGGGRN